MPATKILSGARLPVMRAAALVGILFACASALAYPPTLYHTVYGLVRDQYGTPLLNSQAQVILKTQGGTTVSTFIDPNLAIGVNYQIKVPMDSGISSDPYKSNALQVATSYTMVVVIGTVTNVPIEMIARPLQLGEPGQMTRADLTLGEDVNHDGIPDDWETAFLNSIGSSLTLANLNAGLDVLHDGRTLMQEYLLGTYPFDPNNPFSVRILSKNSTGPVLEFPTMTGRAYTVFASGDLQHWTPVPFRLVADGLGGTLRTNYSAATIDTLQIQVVPALPAANVQFFKVRLQ